MRGGAGGKYLKWWGRWVSRLVPGTKNWAKVAYGVKLDEAVGFSHFWDAKGYYTHACLPRGWLAE